MASSSAIEAARAFVRIFADDSQLKKTLLGLRSTVGAAMSGIGKVGMAVGGAAIASGVGLVASGFTAAAASVWRFVDAGAGLQDVADRTGASTEALSQLRYAAEQSGSNLEAVEKGMRKLGDVTTQAAGGSKSAAAALESVGLSASQLMSMSVEDRFLAVAEGISKIEDPAAQASVAMDLLGKSGADLVPMMADGAKGIADLMAEADQLGMTITGPQAKAAAAFDDSWQRLLSTLRNAGNVIAVAVIPYITQAMDLFAAAWPAVMNLANALGTALVSAANGVYQAMTELVTPFEGLAAAVGDTFGAIFAALTANDIGAAADVFWASLNVAWTTGIAAITDQWYAWKNGFLDVFDEATGAVAVKWFEFKNTIVNIFVSAITSIKNAWTDFQSWLSSWVIADMQILGIIDNADEVQKTLQETTKAATDKATAQADAALAASDVATAEQIAEVRAATQREQQRRADEYARQLDKAQADLDSARAAWSTSVAQASSAAATAANQPNVADTATGKFDELIRSMKTGEIATRVDKAVQQAGPAQDIRTSAGAGVLTSIINQQGTLSQQQLSTLKEMRDLQRRLVKVTSDGMIGWAV